MNRVEFMKKLEWLLSDISESERDEALQYYNDYLNDAGVENEEAVIESLGSPEKLAFTIKAGLSGNEAGEFTESGYHDFEEEKNTVTEWKSYNEYDSNKAGETTAKPVTKKKMSTGMLVFIIIMCIVFGPVILGVAAGILAAIFGILVALLATVISLFIAAVAVALSLLVSGVVLFGVGIAGLFTEPAGGGLIIGLSLLCIGIGLVFAACTVWIAGKGIPAVIRLVVDVFSRIFHGRKGANA